MDAKVLFVLWLIGYSATQTFSYYVGYRYAGWEKGDTSVSIAALVSLVFWVVVTIELWPF